MAMPSASVPPRQGTAPPLPRGPILHGFYLRAAASAVNQTLNELQIPCQIDSNFGRGSTHVLSRAELLGSRHLPVV